ncbi:hypothetical protein LTR10_022014 [Elasticomyces elasticus]|uniref:Uncharacterized protein n=1 Tax=Exophiala sideris TaxID=1016849 RepID=A0ABR0IYY1_9EURO|nr:hypothetical protein LTR10_022014 [Elasticomyces elasticus]KAK5022905.1 hypothetical protein LTS07_009633 [Exophiala sideris]KAK5026416.1 hypothetical protein LTR13_010030 [Exophiala sideris]KAK5052351.1 hypothetical protein LTR69_009887 [Exophiala sideris]KAK5177378.1 hypothetical protein LTR44_010173 [Eurotiomycetes sp. CCFEE 6388]
MAGPVIANLSRELCPSYQSHEHTIASLTGSTSLVLFLNAEIIVAHTSWISATDRAEVQPGLHDGHLWERRIGVNRRRVMPEEQWRDEFQEYGLLLQAVASGDRSKVLKHLGDYLVNQGKDDPGPATSASGGAQGQFNRRQQAQQANKNPVDEEDFDPDDNTYHEEDEEYPDEGQYEDYGEEEYPAEEEEQYSMPKPRKKVRFADEEGTYPLEENEPGHQNDDYDYDGTDDAYYGGEYDPDTHDGTYDGEPYMSGALAEDNGINDEYYVEPYDEGYDARGDMNATAPARKPPNVKAYENNNLGYNTQPYDGYNQEQGAGTSYAPEAYPHHYEQGYHEQDAAAGTSDAQGYYHGTEAGYAYENGTEPSLAESGGEWQHHFPQHNLDANDEEQARGIDELGAEANPFTDYLTHLQRQINHVDPGLTYTETDESYPVNLQPLVPISESVHPDLDYTNYQDQLDSNGLDGVPIDDGHDNGTDQANHPYHEYETAAINTDQNSEDPSADFQNEFNTMTGSSGYVNDADSGGVQVDFPGTDGAGHVLPPATEILPKRKAVGIINQKILPSEHSPIGQGEECTSDGFSRNSPAGVSETDQTFDKPEDTGPSYNLEALIPNIERPRKEEPWVPEVPDDEELEEYSDEDEEEYMSNNPLRHIYEAEKNEAKVRPYFDDAPLPFDLSQDYWEEPWDEESYSSSLYYNEDMPQEDYDSTADYYIDPQYNVFEEGSRFYTHYNDSANESQMQRNPSTRSGSSRKSAMSARSLFGKIRERLA